MFLHVLFMQRRETYEGEYGPEALCSVDEFILEENPAAWAAKVADAKVANKDEAAGFAEVVIEVNGDVIRRRCLGDDRPIKGAIKEEEKP